MEALSPAYAPRASARRRFASIVLLAVVIGGTLFVADRARSAADERRQAQAELRRAQAAVQQIRAVAAESVAANRVTPNASREGYIAARQLTDSVTRLETLGVTGPHAERLEASVAKLYESGRSALIDSLSPSTRNSARREYERTVEPLLLSVIADTDAQSAIEDERASDAGALARRVLIGGVLCGLLLLGLVVRRLEASARRGRADAMMRQQAFTDALTGLPNRAALELALAHRLTGGEEGDEVSVTMALLDLDDLKTINDSLGHGRGDELVRTIGARVSASLGPHDLVARFGGDEFGVVFHDPAPEAAYGELERVLQAIHRPVRIGDRDVRVTASAGLASGTDVESVVRDADIAMYAAKSGGKDRVKRFTPEMRADALASLELTSELRRALTRDELFLEYQPIVELSQGRVEGVEALVRWMHPTRGRMPPFEFIGLAERTGLISPLGWWVMRAACQQMVDWMDDGLATQQQHVSVNVSPIQLADSNAAQRIAAILDETGLSPKQLQIEITESVLVDQDEELVADLSKLMALGVRIAIDDFGTGHSVLAYLKDLPVDVLKIDKAFVDDIDTDAGRARLTQGIVQLAQALNLSVVAEGIETAPQATLLHGLGEMLGQGYLYSRPVSADEAGVLLRDGLLGTAGIPVFPRNVA